MYKIHPPQISSDAQGPLNQPDGLPKHEDVQRNRALHTRALHLDGNLLASQRQSGTVHLRVMGQDTTTHDGPRSQLQLASDKHETGVLRASKSLQIVHGGHQEAQEFAAIFVHTTPVPGMQMQWARE
jgi:hypothetical protein